jgi:integrase
VWTIPGRGKGGGEDHRIPLTPAAIALMGAPGKADALVFPGRKGKPLRDMAIRSLLKRMGHVGHDHVTPHGFRSTFRDWAGETTNHPREVAERALAHKLEDKAEASYARGDLFQKRRVLMADWANYACGVKGTLTVLRQPAAMHA